MYAAEAVPYCSRMWFSLWEEEFKKVLMRVPSIISYNEKKMFNNTIIFFIFFPILLLLRLVGLFFLIKHFILFIIISVVLLSKCFRLKRGDVLQHTVYTCTKCFSCTLPCTCIYWRNQSDYSLFLSNKCNKHFYFCVDGLL